ncbi:hypothetical protein K3728_00345 [Rhodobacteraceae bacterium M385]|nr:hypothetical protein K3728_00345 [Rhodobacteraceae bacterium M385]
MLEDTPIGPPRAGELQVVLATDGGYAPRVEIAAYSLLKHATGPVRMVLFCTEDAKGKFPRLDKAMKEFPNARLEYVFPKFLKKVAIDHQHRFPPAAFGRMLIAHLMEGRVLYLDGDILVRHDMSIANDYDLEGNLVAAARDIILFRDYRRASEIENATTARQRAISTRSKQALKQFQGFGLNLEVYYNSGVMIFDCDAIRRDAKLHELLLDYERARQYPTFDQDLINLLFAGRVKELDQTWNAWSAIGTTARAPYTEAERAQHALARKDPKILHFYGGTKPWSKLHVHHFNRGFRWNLEYWLFERAFNKKFG